MTAEQSFDATRFVLREIARYVTEMEVADVINSNQAYALIASLNEVLALAKSIHNLGRDDPSKIDRFAYPGPPVPKDSMN